MTDDRRPIFFSRRILLISNVEIPVLVHQFCNNVINLLHIFIGLAFIGEDKNQKRIFLFGVRTETKDGNKRP